MLEGLLAFVLTVASHALLMRLLPGSRTVGKLVLVAGVWGLGLAYWLYTRLGLTIEALAGLLLFGLLCELYVFCFTLTMNSVSTRLLLLLWRRPRTPAELTARVGPEAAVSYRVDTLVRNGFLEEDATGPRLTPRARRTLATFDMLRRFFRHD